MFKRYPKPQTVIFDNFDDADEVLKDYLLFDDVNERFRPDLEELNDDNNVIQ